MTTTTDRRPTENWALVDAIASDPAPLPTMHRREILLAIIACATEHDGEVHASWVRPLLPAGVNEHLIGNVTSQLTKAGILVKTGRYLPSGQRENRNATKDLPVRRVTNWDALEVEARR